MTAASRERFADVVRTEPVDLGLACALIAVEASPELDVGGPLRELDRLAASAEEPVAELGGPEGLRVALGEHGRFRGSGEDYVDLRASLLPDVLRRRRGLPILLSVVWLEVAGRLGVPAEGVGLPGHFVARIDGTVVDPYAGGPLMTMTDVAARVHDTAGIRLHPDHLEPWSPADILLRVLANIRGLAGRTTDLRTGLWATDLSLLLPRHPLALRRERGELLVRLGDFAGGARELEDFAAAVESVEPETAEKVRGSARLARARLN